MFRVLRELDENAKSPIVVTEVPRVRELMRLP